MARLAKRTAPVRKAGGTRPPGFRPVQLAALTDAVPRGGDWLHEMKYDGYRCLLAVGGGCAVAYTRSGLDWSDRFAPIVGAAARLRVGSALIDGEAVILDADGRSNFQALQAALKDGVRDLVFIAFDLLELDGEDIAGLAQVDRKRRLSALLADASDVIRYSEHIEGGGETLFDAPPPSGLEPDHPGKCAGLHRRRLEEEKSVDAV